MTVGLLANENWPQPSLRALQAAGFDVQAVAELMPRASDLKVLQHAAQTGRWVLTFDRDYGELVFARRADWVQGHLVVVSGRSIRRRLLPTG